MTRRRTAGVIALAILLPMLIAAGVGGFPSRPRFQSVGVGVAAPAAGNIAISGSMTSGTVPDARLSSNVPLKNAVNTFTAPQAINAGSSTYDALVLSTTHASGILLTVDGSAGTGLSGIRFSDGGVARGYVASENTAGATCGTGSVEGDLCIRLEPGGKLRLSTDGGTTSHLVPKHAYGQLISNATPSCTLAGTKAASGVVSCVRNSLGVSTVTLSAGIFSVPPICTANGNGGAIHVATLSNSATSITLYSFNSTPTQVDTEVNLVCVGT